MSSCSGPGNEAAAREALAAFPGGLHVGGGIDAGNAAGFLEAGASHVIVTSWIFRGGRLDRERLRQLAAAIGKNRLVLDLSCRRKDGRYFVVTDRWQKFTELEIGPDSLSELAQSCAEFLVHAADVEGLRLGMDLELIDRLGQWSPLPATVRGRGQFVARSGGRLAHRPRKNRFDNRFGPGHFRRDRRALRGRGGV